MKRDIRGLSESQYDVIIVGGGIFGCCAAWDAASRGLSVALVEKQDFSHATSANCFKIIHGGIRYLQHGDVPRIRESSRERNAFLRIAPHLVKPLPIVIPTYGHGMEGKEILTLGTYLYGAIVFDRNRGIHDPARKLPLCDILSRKQVLELFPALDQNGLTGAVIIYDGQMYNPPRLALAFLQSAVQAGAQVANYLEMTKFLQSGNRVTGIHVTDRLTGNSFQIAGKVVVNAAGPWAEQLFSRAIGQHIDPGCTFSRDACFVVKKRLVRDYALAMQGRTTDPDARVSRKARHLFAVPWRDYTLVGVWHIVHKGAPEDFTVTESEIQGFIDEVNGAYPDFGLTMEDVTMWNAGLVLFGENTPGAKNLKYGHRSRLIDHARDHNVENLISLIGVRYTMARREAQRVIDMVYRKLGQTPPKSNTATTAIYGGHIHDFEGFLQQAIEERPPTFQPDIINSLVCNHGSEYRNVLTLIPEDSTLGNPINGFHVIRAEVIHAIRREMAQKLSDVVFRRTDLGTGSYPGEHALQECADLMASELGWDSARIRQELSEVDAEFPFKPIRQREESPLEVG